MGCTYTSDLGGSEAGMRLPWEDIWRIRMSPISAFVFSRAFSKLELVLVVRMGMSCFVALGS